ncbi:hypothetical protein HHI36_013993 [Cryptolaemus montrouzieri]|uniref:ATPase AAA-type core domain-containing protein n=1 Tax=Cryptolaemus montrouzieri TaxID=559131 RepID=A0ABD2N285_9CUCU
MKDIKEYFKGSTDHSNSPKDIKSNEESKEKPLETAKSRKSRKSLKNNKKRKKTDKNDISNVSENIPDQEIIKSPKCAHSVPQNNGEMLGSEHLPEDNQELKILSTEDSDKTGDSSKTLQVFLNRNKVIGSNSPGKELIDEEEIISDVTREKLAARKKLLQNWSNSKKAKKRKLEDEEIDKCIKAKLDIRKKRFKSLLNIEYSDHEHSEETKGTTLSSSEQNIKRQSSLANFGISLCDNSLNIDKIEVQAKKKCKDIDETNKSPLLSKSKHWKLRIKLTDDDSLLSPIEPLSNNQNTESSKIQQTDVEVIDDNKLSEKLKDVINVDDEGNIKALKNQKPSKEKEETVYNDDEVIIVDEHSELPNQESCNESAPNNEFKRTLRNRNSLQKPKNDDFMQLSSDESSDETFKVKEVKKTLKVAPVFVKAVPKPKLNPEVLEARRKFLMSDMPDTLRKKVEKQESSIVPDFDVFPKISHVRQESNDEHLWNLPMPNLSLKNNDLPEHLPGKLTLQSIIDNAKIEESKFEETEPIRNVKNFIMNLKLENPEYPVYKSFRLLKEKSGIENIIRDKKSPRKRGRPRKSAVKKENIPENCKEISNAPEHQMWNEKYKPRSFEDLVGNVQATSSLKKWLQSWHEAFENGKKKTRRYSSDSESDFISSDNGSILGGSSLTNTIILTGPCGSGKSSSVYAICHELGLNVIELNASSRRTGKQVLQELQEATQSHQVRKNKEALFPIKKDSKLKADKKENKSRKMCVLLVEDIDIVFEQDEGFISAISQISAISKRPIILTTSTEKSIYSQKFINDIKTIRFRQLTTKSMGIWLQVLCLLEGVFVDISSINEFIEYNNGDIRKILLELQFWIQSGGQINKHKNLLNEIFKVEDDNHKEDSIRSDDDVSNISLKEIVNKDDIFRTHSNIISDFEIFQLEKFYNIPLSLDLGKIWWNVSKFLNIESAGENHLNPLKKSRKNKKKIKIISDMYDSLGLCDVSLRRMSYKCDSPVCSKRWYNSLQDSLELREVYSEYPSDRDFLFEWNHYLIDGCLNICKERFINNVPKNQRLMNMAVPVSKYVSELAKNHHYEQKLMNAIPLSNHLHRKSVSLDYLPTVRNIARSEKNRADNSEKKRHNRFHNYLKNLNIDCNNLVLDFACNTLVVKRKL